MKIFARPNFIHQATALDFDELDFVMAHAASFANFSGMPVGAVASCYFANIIMLPRELNQGPIFSIENLEWKLAEALYKTDKENEHTRR